MIQRFLEQLLRRLDKIFGGFSSGRFKSRKSDLSEKWFWDHFAFIGRLVSDSLPARRPVTTATEKAGQAE
jgi:hypothetical protein